MTTSSATPVLPSKIIAGTSHTLQANEDGVTLICTNASAVTLTIPAGLPDDFGLAVVQQGAGAVTFAAGAGVTLAGPSGLVTSGAQHGTMALLWVSADSFVTAGNLA